MSGKKISSVQRNFVSADAKCPFYIGERWHEIRCQGYEDGFECALIFNRPDERESYTDLYCDNLMRCIKCRTYKSLMEVEDEKV